jgi:hypothetical protein
MKQYPTIQRQVVRTPIYAFDKLDGSNIRAEWDKKKGFWKFGSRKRLLGEDQGILKEAEDLIQEKYAEALARVFADGKHLKGICFFEFYGPHSFAGNHANEPHDVVLIDINPFKKGILPPREFLKQCGHLHIPELLYHGNPNQPFVESVKDSTLEGMTEEGVVCKAKGKGNTILMFKVKSRAWIDRLKGHCGDNTKLFEQLL